jgi:hypothetical protein
MDNIFCKICNLENPDNKHFWNEHKITIKNYYEKHFPKNDLFNNLKIEFKGDVETYLSKNFVSRTTLLKWLKSVTKEEYTKYIKDYLIARKNNKNLIYSPCQVELKTLNQIPGMKWISDNIEDYYTFCGNLGFINRFKRYTFDESLFKDISNKVIFADKREQNELEFSLQTRHKSMTTGDYRVANSSIRIERKSLNDVYSTMSGGLERFLKEIERAKKENLYLIVLVESSFNNIYMFPKMRQFLNKKLPSPDFITHNIRSILEKNNFVQFVFVKNREEAGKMVETLFSADEQCKEIDIQYIVDIKEQETL